MNDDESDVLTPFLLWFLQNGMLAIFPAGVFDYGPTRSLVLFRSGEFQAELFIMAPNTCIEEEHRHPAVDTYQVHLWGEFTVTIGGQPASTSILTPNPGRTYHVTRIRPTDWHGAKRLPGGGAFLSIQHWRGVPPTSIGLSWEGRPPSMEHELLLDKARAGST